MDKQKVTLLVLLDLSAAFDTISHVTMKNILENDFGFRDTSLQWIISFLTDRKQHVVIPKSTSKPFDLSSGVPQGSCLGPILFVLYASRLFHVIDKHLPDAQGYADDTQLYLSFRPDSTSSQEEALRALEDCIADIRAWMVNHQLKLNDNNTEFIIIGSPHQLSKVRMDSINVGLSEIKSASSLRDLGAWFDECMTMNKHVSKVCSKAFGTLYKINKIREFLTEETTKTLIHTFVSSHLDYCNSLLYGIPQYQMNRLQRVLNAAARLTCRLPRFAHVTTALFRLHWLPIRYRILYKIALLAFKVLKRTALSYLSDLLVVQTKNHYSLEEIASYYSSPYPPNVRPLGSCLLSTRP